jgi:hypothetical protein
MNETPGRARKLNASQQAGSARSQAAQGKTLETCPNRGRFNRRFAMNTLTRTMTGAAAAALVTLTAAAPAQAQYRDYDPYDPYYRSGVNTGDIIRGVAVAGAAAAAVGAISNAVRGGLYGGYGYPQGGYGYPQGGYGYPQGGYGNYGYGDRAAVDACAYQAQRYGRMSITDVDRRGSRSYRVRGVIDAAYNSGYGGYGYNRYPERRSFKCDAREDGRVTDFDTKRIRY